MLRGLDHAIGHGAAFVLHERPDEERELVAAQPHQDVLASVQSKEEVRERDEHTVALGMAVRVVDGLEAGEVEQKARPVGAVRFEFGPALVDVAAVETTGQGIADAHLLETSLHLLARRDVADQRADTTGASLRVHHECAVDLGGKDGAVAPLHVELAEVLVPAAHVAAAALLESLLDTLPRFDLGALVVAVGEDVLRGQVHDVLGGAAEDLAGEAVHEEDAFGREVAF